MVDRWTDRFFRPALIGSWIGAVTLGLALTLGRLAQPLVQPVTDALAALAAVMFVTMLLDSRTRQAVKTFNATTARSISGRNWVQKLFAPEYGDRRLLIANRFVWFEFFAATFRGDPHLGVLAFVSFAVSSLMLILGLKRLPSQKEGVC